MLSLVSKGGRDMYSSCVPKGDSTAHEQLWLFTTHHPYHPLVLALLIVFSFSSAKIIFQLKPMMAFHSAS